MPRPREHKYYNSAKMWRYPWVWCFFLAAFAQAQTGYLTLPTDINPGGLAAADLNGDGRPDLVIANRGSNSLTILMNDGRGGFTALAPFSFGNANPAFASLAPIDIIAADLNGDHKTDLIVLTITSVPLVQNASVSGPVVLLGNGDGTFQPPQPVSGCGQVTSARVADLNGDGTPDLAITCLIGGFLIPTGAFCAILPGNGDGTFGMGTTYELGFTPWAVLALGDFNQDGNIDVAAASGNNLTVLLNDGKANFKVVTSNGEPWNFAPGIAAVDFNGDGLLDLAVSGQSRNNPAAGTITVLRGRGDGTFQAASRLETTGFGLLVAQDLNGDGRVDLVEGLSNLVFFAGRGDGTFEDGRAFGGSGSTGYLALAYFTGTGALGWAGTNDFTAPDGTQLAGDVVILPRAVWPSLTLANVSAGGYGLGPLAPGSIASAFGQNLAAQSVAATGTPPLSLGGVTVSVTDSAGVARQAQLYYVSSQQVNYVIPADSAAGLATVSISADGQVTATGQIEIIPAAPTLFIVNAENLAAANVVRVSQNGDQTFESIYQTDQNGNISALPIDLGSETDSVYLVLYGTGIRNIGRLGGFSATIGGILSAPATYVGPQGTYAGLDQVNLLLPPGLASASARTVSVEITLDGQPSNRVTLLIQ
jgi:uncharacterized protein (TIGR03437 family)